MEIINNILILVQSIMIAYLSYMIYNHNKVIYAIKNITKKYQFLIIDSYNKNDVRQAYKNLLALGYTFKSADFYTQREFILLGSKKYYCLCELVGNGIVGNEREPTDEELLEQERYEELAKRKRKRNE